MNSDDIEFSLQIVDFSLQMADKSISGTVFLIIIGDNYNGVHG